MKWLDQNTLFVTHKSAMDKISKNGKSWAHEQEFIESETNTIEDFVFWNDYAIFINYSNRIWLADLSTGQILDSSYYGGEHMKSISLLDGGIVALTGRSGTIKTYIIHSEQILPAGET